MTWRTYRDPAYRFRIDYPPDYTIVERGTPAELTPMPLQTVAFLSRQLAQSPTAGLQAPNALIEVFPPPAGKALSDWIQQHEPKGTRTSIRIGALEGYRVTLPILLAPNEFIFFGSDAYIYRLTFLSEYAERMLQSFRIEG
jgi:hypothetical protein